MIDPVLLRLGFLEIRYYGIVYVLGVLLVYFWLKRNNVRRREEVLFSVVLGMFLGARALGLLVHGVNIFSLEFFRVWNGGMSFFGGLIGSVLGGWYVVKKYDLDFYKICDVFVLPVSFILILGRLTNYLNQELLGRCFLGVCHLYTLYSAFLHLVLFLVLVLIYKKNFKKGVLFFSFILGYGILRFVTEFFRDNVKFLEMSGWQVGSLILIVIGVVYLRRLKVGFKE